MRVFTSYCADANEAGYSVRMTTQNLLDGIRILDLSLLLPGPLCTWHLQSIGAHIVKIEPPGAGDYAKHMGALDDDGVSHFYKSLNGGKQMLQLDLKSAPDRARFLELAATADAVIEGFRPGVMARLGLSHDVLLQANPRICLVSISGYGQTGALAAAAGHDINYMAAAGMLHEMIGTADAAFIAMPNLQFGDVLGGAVTAAFMTSSAILCAQRSGTGRLVDVSMTHSLHANAVMPCIETRAFGAPTAAGQGLLNGGAPCYGMYRTRDDRYLAVGALEAKFWQALCEAIGRADLREAHWQFGLVPGSAAAQAVRTDLAATFAREPLAHWLHALRGADCCVNAVLRMDEVLAGHAGIMF
jgi:alpha-methylacyl-CoA racemase